MASWLLTAANPEIVPQTRKRPMLVGLVLLVVSVFINYVDRGNLSIAAPLLKNELGISASQLGILLSSFFWTYTTCLFLCGWFVDRVDATLALASGLLLWSVATAATGAVRGFAMLLVMRMVLGMGESVAFPCYSKILAEHLPEQSRGFANGALIAGMKLGPAAGTLGAGVLMAIYGWRPVFIGIGLISLLWLPAWMKWRPRTETVGHSRESQVSVVDILRQRKFWATAIGGFCVAYPLYFTITWLPFYLVRERQLSMSEMVNKAALYYTVDAAAALVTGWVTDCWIRRGFGIGVVRKTAMALGWMTAAIGFLGCSNATSHSYWAWLIVVAVGCGTGNACFWTFVQTLAGPTAVGRWCSFKNGFSNLAGIICPALTGFTVDWTGHFHVAIAVTAAVCVFGAIVWVFFLGELKPVNWGHSGDKMFGHIGGAEENHGSNIRNFECRKVSL